MGIYERVFQFLDSGRAPKVDAAFSKRKQSLPTLWLLGKTGAGKSSLIQAVTGNSRVRIGNGYSPCTMTSQRYDFPEEKPLLRFLDTRGLADADYDARQDIEACQNRANALIVVMKAEEPEQGHLLKALSQIRRSWQITQVLLVHTGICLVEDTHERGRCISHNQKQAEKAWGVAIESVAVDFDLGDGSTLGVSRLKEKLAERLPIVAQLGSDQEHASREESHFARLKPEILWYAGAAGASDVVPLAGTVSVPAIQARMLYAIAGRYGMEWDKKSLTEFAAALGTGFGAQYAAKLGIRQLAKLIPVYGQTVGSATAAVVSFCSTYAIGRVACKYMYHRNKGEPVSEAELRAMYKKAFDSIKETAKSEAGGK